MIAARPDWRLRETRPVTSGVDLDADDFEQSPWLYPGTPPPGGGLLWGSDFLPLTPKPKRRLGQAQVEVPGVDRTSCLNVELLLANAAQIDYRHLVVAVGSNASPAVMRRRFRKGRVSTTVPFVAATVRGLGIGHSAHVSAGGYIAAAPYLDPDATSEVFVSLLTSRQLTCLDDSEPNYLIRHVGSTTCQLTLEGGERPDAFVVYVSKWGLLARDDGTKLPLVDQETLFAELRATCAPFAALADGGDYQEVMAR